MSPERKCFSFAIGLFVLVSLTSGLQAQLTRAQAVAALLDLGSGVTLDLTESTVWSPFVDFGFGSGFEGMLPVGSVVEPQELGELPIAGSSMSVVVDSYLFWIDDAPVARFQHPTRFVLVDASNAIPTVGNGGIVVATQGWWPVVTVPGPFVTVHFSVIEERVTDNPLGFENPEGHITGPVTLASELLSPPAAITSGPAVQAVTATNNACGLILRGFAGADFANDFNSYDQDLCNHYNLDPNRIIKANSGNPASKQDLCDAITALCALNPPCDKIYVRMVSHGNKGTFTLTDGKISAADLCTKFKKIAKKGVPICLLIDACYSGSLLDGNRWNFPAGSSIITSADADSCFNGILDGLESDTDCGGPDCSPCVDGSGCFVNDDCQSLTCVDGFCQSNLCGDGVCNVVNGECSSCVQDCGSEPACDECCVAHSTPGCSDPIVEACVCAQDSFCCNDHWD